MENKDLLIKVLGIIDGHKAVYSQDAVNDAGEVYAKEGEDKRDEDSESNETIGWIIEAIEKEFGHLLN